VLVNLYAWWQRFGSLSNSNQSTVVFKHPEQGARPWGEFG